MTARILPFPLQRMTATSFVGAVMRRARELRDERLANISFPVAGSASAIDGGTAATVKPRSLTEPVAADILYIHREKNKVQE